MREAAATMCPSRVYDVGYLRANFSQPRPLCSRLRPDVRDRQTSDVQTVVRRASSLTALYLGAGAIIMCHNDVFLVTRKSVLQCEFSQNCTLHGSAATQLR